jgi:ribosomal protein S27E
MMMVTCPSCQKKTKRKCLNCGETEAIHHADKDAYQCKNCGQTV